LAQAKSPSTQSGVPRCPSISCTMMRQGWHHSGLSPDNYDADPLDWSSTPRVSMLQEGNMCCFVAVPEQSHSGDSSKPRLQREFDIIPSRAKGKKDLGQLFRSCGKVLGGATEFRVREQDLRRCGSDLELLKNCHLPLIEEASSASPLLPRSKYTLQPRDCSAARLTRGRPAAAPSKRAGLDLPSLQTAAALDAASPPRPPARSRATGAVAAAMTSPAMPRERGRGEGEAPVLSLNTGASAFSRRAIRIARSESSPALATLPRSLR